MAFGTGNKQISIWDDSGTIQSSLQDSGAWAYAVAQSPDSSSDAAWAIANLGAPVYLYANLSDIPDPTIADPTAMQDGVSYDRCASQDYFAGGWTGSAISSTGTPTFYETGIGYSNTVLANIGNTTYVAEWTTNWISRCQSMGATGIHIDNIISNYAHTANSSSGIPQGNFNTAGSGWDYFVNTSLTYVVSHMHAAGLKVGCNINAYGSSYYTSDNGAGDRTWNNLIITTGLDLTWHEYWLILGNGAFASVDTGGDISGWIGMMTDAQTSGVSFVGHPGYGIGDGGTQPTAQRDRYGKGAFLTYWDGNHSSYVHCSSDGSWTADYGYLIGDPVGAIGGTAQGTGFMRTYTNGVVCWNTSNTSSQTFTLPGGTFVSQAGTTGITGTVSVPALDSVFLQGAPSGGVPTVSTSPAVSPTTAAIGTVLSCTTGTWTNSPTSYTYQWQSSPTNSTYTNISGATSSSYTIISGEITDYLRCEVTATNGTGSSIPANSNVVGPVYLSSAITWIAERYTNGTVGNLATLAFHPTSACVLDDFLVLMISTGDGLGTVSGVVDTKGNTWSVDVSLNVANNGISICSCYLTTALATTDTITVTAQGPGAIETALMEEFSNVGGPASTSLDKTATNSGSGSTFDSGVTGTLTGSGDLYIGAWSSSSPLTMTVGSPYLAFPTKSLGSYVQLSAEYYVGTSTSADAQMTTTSTGTWTGAIATYKTVSSPISTAPPAITGTTTVGSTLTCGTGSWGGAPTGYTYQWARDNFGVGTYTNISGATAATHVLLDADDGCHLDCVVTATNASGSAAATSTPSGVIREPAPTNSVAPAVTGTTVQGSTLTSTTGTWANMAGHTPLVTALSPSSGLVGASVSVSAMGFATSSTVTVKVGGINAAITAGAVTNSSGNSIITFTIPAVPFGNQTIIVTDASANTAFSATLFTIAASATGLTPTSGVVGSAATITAQGFAASSALSVKVGGVAATITSGGTSAATGSSTINFTVPAAANGSQTVIVTDASGDTATSATNFTVSGSGPVATALKWVTQPSNVNVNTNITPGPTIQVVDQNGANFSGVFTVSMTLSTGSFTSGSSTSGSTSSGGEITFGTLAIATAGNYTMTASCSGLTSSPASSSFTVASSGTYVQVFAPASAFNKMPPANAPIHPNSASMIGSSAWTAPGGQSSWFTFVPRASYFASTQANFSDMPSQTVHGYFGPSGTGCSEVTMTAPIPTELVTIMESTAWGGGSPFCEDTDMLSYVFNPNGDLWLGYRTTPPGYIASDDAGCSTSIWNSVLMGDIFSSPVGPFVGAMNPNGTGFGNGLGYHGDFSAASGACIAAGNVTAADITNCMGSTSSIINHCLRMTTENCAYPEDTNTTSLLSFFGLGSSGGWYYDVESDINYVPPAYGGANNGQTSGAAGMPTGARLMLNLSFAQINSWPSLLALEGTTTSGLQGAWMLMCRTMSYQGGYGVITVDGQGAGGAGGINVAIAAPPGSNGYPWEIGSSWPNNYSLALPSDLLAHFVVLDWTKWTGTGAAGT